MRKVEQLLILALLMSSFAALASAQGVAGGEATSLTLNYNNSRYNANSTINASNVGNLQLSWLFNTSSWVTATPMVLNGNTYFSDWDGNVYSVNTLTGQQNWMTPLGFNISSTPLLYNGNVYIALGPGNRPTNVYELSQSNGSIIWSNTLRTNSYNIYASPIVYKNLLYIGVTGDANDNETNDSVIGQIFALNASSGATVWSFNTMVGNTGGSGVWGSVVVDPVLNSVYFGTSNPYDIEPNENTLYGYAIMSLNATNGNLNWYYQVYNTIEQGGDSDFGSTPNLFTMSVNGTTTNVVGLGNKNGIYYIWNRETGALLDQYSVGNGDEVGIIGLAGFIYLTNAANPELFIDAHYNATNESGEGGVVEALYPANGTVAWRTLTPGILIGPVSIAPGIVSVGDDLGNIYVMSTANGNILFHAKLPHSVEAGVTIAEGHLFAPTTFSDGKTNGVYAFSLPANLSVSLSATRPISGENEILTATSANGGASNAYTFYFVDPSPSNIPITGCSNVSGGAGVNCTFVASIGSYTYGVGVTNGSQVANSVPIVVNVTNTSISTTSTTTSTTSTPTTIIGGGIQGSGGGGGGGGGGGSAKPIITNQTNGFTVNGIAQLGNFGNVFCGEIFHVTDNYITPNYTGLTINNKIYTLYLDRPVALNASADCYIELLNVSYLPILQTVELEFFTNKTSLNSASESSNTTTTAAQNVTSSTVKKTTSILTTTIAEAIAPARQTQPTNQTNSSNTASSGTLLQKPGSGFSVKDIAIVVIGIVIAIGIATIFFTRKRGGKRWNYKVDSKYTYTQTDANSKSNESESPESKADWKS